MARASCGIVARLPVLPHRCQQVRAFSSSREDAAAIGRRVPLWKMLVNEVEVSDVEA